MRICAEGSEIWELFLELFCPPRVIGGDRGTGVPPPKLKLTPDAAFEGYVRPAETLSTAKDTARDGLGCDGEGKIRTIELSFDVVEYR